MTFSELIRGIKTSAIIGKADANTIDVETDPRKIEEGNLFVAIKSIQVDGHRYIPRAIKLGAVVTLCEETPRQSQPNVTCAVAKSTEDEVGKAATRLFGDPSRHLKLVGVTGTNGETTVATLLYNLSRKLGHKYRLLSTVCNFIEGQEVPADHTTPDPAELNELLAKMLAASHEYVFMEYSSHVIAQKRIGGLTFAGGILIDLTRDHLGYHKTFENYRNAKKSFFDGLPKPAFAITNADDKNGMVMVQDTKASVKAHSIQSMADFKVRIIECRSQEMYLAIDGQETGVRFTGRFNVSNLLTVYGAARILSKQREETLTAVSTLHTVNGRMDTLRSPEGFITIIDYAHMPGTLKNILLAIHEVDGKGYIITVCGASDNRDKGKRPLMAEQAVQFSDKVIITSGNPRFKGPQDIINDMLAGLDAQDQKKVLTITDRGEVIRIACVLAQKQGVIFVAGKECETYQEIKDVKHHFNGKEVLRNTFVQ